MWTARREGVWKLLNASVMPVWLAMFVAPRSKATATLVRNATVLHGALGAAYVAHLVEGRVRGPGADFASGASVAQALAGHPATTTAAWTHYLTFDLFVGAWIHEQALAQGRTARLELLLTLFAGPAGLSLWLARQGRR